MNNEPIDIALDFDGIHYSGWATPAEKHHENGWPKSFHVVLNETFFGNVSFDDGKWLVDEQRPDGMANAVGAAIQSKYKPVASVKS
jgi:hypothetical protein